MSTVLLRRGTLNLIRGEVCYADGQSARLSSNELQLLSWLVARPNQDHSREELLGVLGYQPGVVSRAADVAISRLRAKLEHNPADPQHLLTVYGVGYRFVPLAQPAQPAPPSGVGFVGRAPALAAVRRFARSGAGLLTVLGIGGVGKTRLVREALREIPGAVWCALATVHTATGLRRAMLHALGLSGSRAPLGALLAQQGDLIVVLDNFEQLVAHADQLARWVAAAPALRLVVTSQVALPVATAGCLTLQPLPEDAAVALYQAHVAHLGGAPAPAAAAAALIRQLDGLPLAIELAAGRSRTLGAQQLSARMGQRFRLLQRDSTGRHRSLEVVLATSWELLSADEQAALHACSAFAGHFTLSDAEALIGTPDAAVLLDALTQRFFVVQDEGGFRLLESPRLFAWTHGPLDRARLEARHAQYVLDAGERLLEEVSGPDAVGALGVLQALEPELRAVRRRCPRTQALHASYVLARLLWRTGQELTPATLMSAHLEDAPPSTVVIALRAMRAQLRSHNDLAAGIHDALCVLQDARALGDPNSIANTLILLSGLHTFQGEAAAAARCAQEALDVLGPGGCGRQVGAAQHQLANARRRQGRLDEADALYARAVVTLDRAGDALQRASARASWGLLLRRRKLYVAAEAAYEAALNTFSRLSAQEHTATHLNNLAAVYLMQERLEAAEAVCARAVSIYQRLGRARGLAYSRQLRVHLLIRQRRYTEARQANLECGAHAEAIGIQPMVDVCRVLRAWLVHLHGDLCEAERILQGGALPNSPYISLYAACLRAERTGTVTAPAEPAWQPIVSAFAAPPARVPPAIRDLAAADRDLRLVTQLLEERIARLGR